MNKARLLLYCAFMACAGWLIDYNQKPEVVNMLQTLDENVGVLAILIASIVAVCVIAYIQAIQEDRKEEK